LEKDPRALCNHHWWDERSPEAEWKRQNLFSQLAGTAISHAKSRRIDAVFDVYKETSIKGVIAWIQKVPNNDQLSLIVTKIIDSPNSFPQNMR
jgi:hypothetical protein